MIKYEILTKLANGRIIAVATTEAASKEEARSKTANFCNMMDVVVYDVRKVKQSKYTMDYHNILKAIKIAILVIILSTMLVLVVNSL